MTVNELLGKLGINKPGTKDTKGNYVIDILDSNDYGKIYTQLDKADMNDVIEYLEASSSLSENSSNLSYKYKNEYLLSLIGNLEDDVYKLVITNI